MSVRIADVGAVCAAGVGMAAFERWLAAPRSCLGPITHLDGEPWLPMHEGGVVPGWTAKVARTCLPDRKAIKLMTRPVQFGVAAALEAWPEGLDAGGAVAGRAMYVGAAVAVDEDWTFREPINASIEDGRFDMRRFATAGHDVLNPLWLVRGLSNNVLAFTALFRDIQGPNDNVEAGEAGPLIALATAAREIDLGRAHVALAGGSDSLAAIDHLFHHHRHGTPITPGEAACFARLEPGQSDDFGLLGSATGSVPHGPAQGPQAPQGAPDALDRLLALAADRADVVPSRVLVGPRLMAALQAVERPVDSTSTSLWQHLGDAGAGSGALLLAAAWAGRSTEGPTALAACGPGGEIAVVILGTLP